MSDSPRHQPRCRWGLQVQFPGCAAWNETACRFDPDTEAKAIEYGTMGVRDGMIDDFRVIDRKAGRGEGTKGETE